MTGKHQNLPSDWTLDGVHLRLSKPWATHTPWVGQSLVMRQLQAAWTTLGESDLAMCPRLVGRPGVGKTTLAAAVAEKMGLPVFIFQATADTRPDDLIITPVLGKNRELSYVASPIVTAMLVGGACILDEGNRMSEKSWASLAALLDNRRYVDSLLTGLRVSAHPQFRFCTTMNEDSSAFELPEYIQSRLTPQIALEFPPPQVERDILKGAFPVMDDVLLERLVLFLTAAHQADLPWSVRDALQVARFTLKQLKLEPERDPQEALQEALLTVVGPEAEAFLEARKGQHIRPVR